MKPPIGKFIPYEDKECLEFVEFLDTCFHNKKKKDLKLLLLYAKSQPLRFSKNFLKRRNSSMCDNEGKNNKLKNTSTLLTEKEFLNSMRNFTKNDQEYEKFCS